MTIAAGHPGPAKRPTESERRLLFQRKVGAPLKDYREVLVIVHRVNMALYAVKAPFHIRIHRLNYTKKGNLSGLMTSPSTSSMMLSQQQELDLKAARQINQDIIDATEDQRWYKVGVYRVDLSQYSQEGGMALVQNETLYCGNNI